MLIKNWQININFLWILICILIHLIIMKNNNKMILILIRKILIISINWLELYVILAMLSKDIISAILKIHKGSGFSIMIVLLILLTLRIFKLNVLVVLLLMMISMIGKKGRIVKVHMFSSIKILLRIWFSYKLSLLLRRIVSWILWTWRNKVLLNLLKLLVRKNLLSLKKMEVLMLKILKKKGKRSKLRCNKSKWWEKIKARII